jgi:GT2 family glycosyltransferase
MALGAAQSVLDSDAMGQVYVVVVDNSEDAAEARYLRQRLPSNVRVDISPENIGFGRACNRGIEGFRGDGILLINPDAALLPGCLKRLQQTLFSTENAGAVSSHIFWDKARHFYLPSSYPPASLVFQELLTNASPRGMISRVLSERWRRHSIKVWFAQRPIKVSNLSGGLVLLKREAVRAAGGLFDSRFFMYFEDTDLFLRMKRARFSLFVEPRARAIHYYDQCGRQNLQQKRSIMAQSRRLFLQKHCRGWRSGARKIIQWVKWLPGIFREGFAPSQFMEPFGLQVPAELRDGWLFEVSPNVNFIPSAGCFGDGPLVEFPEACWRASAPGRYFGRLGSPHKFGSYAWIVTWMVGGNSVSDHSS